MKSNYVPTLFTRGATLTVQPEGEFTISEKSVNESWKKIIVREKEKRNPPPWLDENIEKWFNGIIIPAILNEFTFTIQWFTQTETHKQIIAKARAMQIKTVYTWLEAKRIIENVILAGEVETRGRGIVVYFVIEGNENFYYFDVWRSNNGQLRFSVNRVFFGKVFSMGDGACFRT
jgi:hypothetical protein